MTPIHPGQILGYLTVLDYSRRYQRWRCRCQCGAIVYRATSGLSAKSRCRECYLKSKEHNQFRLSINPQPDYHPLTSSSTSRKES